MQLLTIPEYFLDLKPDTIGFTEDMKLKLFDFGLMICVKRPILASDVYQMSGCTGSLRYMAPEVSPAERDRG